MDTGDYYGSVLRNDPEYVAYLERRIATLESRLPNTALLSRSFITRAFAVLGHYVAAGLFSYLGIGVVFGLMALLMGVLGQ